MIYQTPYNPETNMFTAPSEPLNFPTFDDAIASFGVEPESRTERSVRINLFGAGVYLSDRVVCPNY